MVEDNGALTRSKARKPPLYSPPTLGGDKKLNIIELTPPPSEGGGRGEVGRVESKAPIVWDIGALFFFKALPFGEGLGGVRSNATMFDDNELLVEVIAALFCFIDALVGVIDALVGVIDALVEVIDALVGVIDALVGVIDALVEVIDALVEVIDYNQ